jgi:hypothetical protein
MAPARHPPPLLRRWNAAVVCRVVLEWLDLVAFESRFTGTTAMELAEKVEQAMWKMN